MGIYTLEDLKKAFPDEKEYENAVKLLKGESEGGGILSGILAGKDEYIRSREYKSSVGGAKEAQELSDKKDSDYINALCVALNVILSQKNPDESDRGNILSQFDTERKMLLIDDELFVKKMGILVASLNNRIIAYTETVNNAYERLKTDEKMSMHKEYYDETQKIMPVVYDKKETLDEILKHAALLMRCIYLQETIIDALKNYESRDAINIKKQKSILDTLSYTKKLTIADVFAECEKDIESQKKLKSAAESGRSSYLKNFLKKSSVARALVGKVYYNDPTSVNTAIDKIAKAGRVTKLLLRLFCGSPSKFTENCPEPYSPPESKQAKGSNPYTNNVFSGAAAKKVDVSLKITAPEKTPDNTNIGDQQQQQPPTAPKKPEEGSLPPNTPAP